MQTRYKHLEKSIGLEKVKLLQAKTVTIIGLGGIGSTCAELLVRSGIGVRIIEKGRVDQADMDRLSLFTEKDIGKFKATEAKKILTAINSEARVKSFNEEITKESMFLAEGDLIMDCAGNDVVTRMIERYCAEKKIPLIYGQVRDSKGIVLTMQGAPCIGATLERIPHEEAPGMLPPAIDFVASIMVSKAYKMLLKEKLKQEAIVYDLYSHQISHPTIRKEKLTKGK